MADFRANEVEENLGGAEEALVIKYGKYILIAVVAIVIAVGGYLAYNTFIEKPSEERAATAIARAEEEFGEGNFKGALNGTKDYEGFLSVAKNYTGTKSANLANLYAGLCYANMEKWKEAAEYLTKYEDCGDMLVSPGAVAALGNVYAHMGQTDKAIESLKKAAEMADAKADEGVNNSTAPIYLIQAGRLLESQKKTAEALALYKSIKAKYLKSDAAQSVDKFIERIGE